jgi:hypothetical protein
MYVARAFIHHLGIRHHPPQHLILRTVKKYGGRPSASCIPADDDQQMPVKIWLSGRGGDLPSDTFPRVVRLSDEHPSSRARHEATSQRDPVGAIRWMHDDQPGRAVIRPSDHRPPRKVDLDQLGKADSVATHPPIAAAPTRRFPRSVQWHYPVHQGQHGAAGAPEARWARQCGRGTEDGRQDLIWQ